MKPCPARKLCSRVSAQQITSSPQGSLKVFLEELYCQINRRDLVHPDPLEFLYQYPDPLEREIAGLVAAALAYGRVTQILKSAKEVLLRLGPSPRCRILGSGRQELKLLLAGFRHRFTSGEALADLLWGAAGLIRRYGSLGECFKLRMYEGQTSTLPALCAWMGEMDEASDGWASEVLSSPRGGSCCKRLHLYLRWMVRKDQVDPGGWEGVGASRLLVPLDVHMHRVGRTLGFTKRQQPDLAAAIEITDGFRHICPEDPVKYDFVLTRPGIWGQAESFWKERRFLDGIPELERPDRW